MAKRDEDVLGVYASTSDGKKPSLVIVNKDVVPVNLAISNVPTGTYFLRHFGGAAGIAKWQVSDYCGMLGVSVVRGADCVCDIYRQRSRCRPTATWSCLRTLRSSCSSSDLWCVLERKCIYHLCCVFLGCIVLGCNDIRQWRQWRVWFEVHIKTCCMQSDYRRRSYSMLLSAKAASPFKSLTSVGTLV